MKDIHDVIVVGAGVAGSSAAMYAARFSLDVKVCAIMPGGLITTTHLVENYPGIKAISGPEMGQLFVEHAMETGAKFHYTTVKNISQVDYTGDKDNLKDKPVFKVIDGTDKEHYAWTIVLATGTEHRHLGVPGEKELANKGVSYCALCDAVFFKGKKVAVVGGGDSAVIEANILAEHASEVHVIVRKDYMRAEPINLNRLQKNPKIQVHYKEEVAELKGDQKLSSILLKSGKTLDVDGVFIAIGWLPQNQLAKDLNVELNDRGMIKISRYGETNIPGVYACGDVTDAEFKQAIIGASEGVAASYKAYKYLNDQGIR